MGDFVAYYSRSRLALLLVGCLGFVGLGLWMGGAFGPPPHSSRYPDAEVFVVGWLGVLFFGLCGVAGIRKLFDSREQLSIGPSGVRYRQWSHDRIPWSEITDVTVWRYKRQKVIVLHLRHPDRFPGRGLVAKFSAVNRRLTGGDLSISMTATDRSFDDAMAAIQQFRPAP